MDKFVSPKTPVGFTNLCGTRRYRHPTLVKFSDLYAPGSINCFVCMQSISDKPTVYAEHLVAKHYSKVDEYLDLYEENDEDTVASQLEALQLNGAARKSGAADLQKLCPAALSTDPALFLLQDLIVLQSKLFAFQLAVCAVETPAANGYHVRITNHSDEARLLGPVHFFNTRTIAVLNSGRKVYLNPGETFKLPISKGVIGVCKYNSLLLAFCSATDETDGLAPFDGTLTWEYHQLENLCCGINTGKRCGPIESNDTTKFALYPIMKPIRNYAKLSVALREYRSPSFRLNEDNYARALRVFSNLDQIEKQLILNSYCRDHTFYPAAFKGMYKQNKQKKRFVIMIPQVKLHMPDLTAYDSVSLRTVDGQLLLRTPILDIVSRGIIITFNPKIKPFFKYTLHFLLGSITYDLENAALDWVEDDANELLQYVFPSPQLALRPSPAAVAAALNWQNVDILSNAEQMQAVQQIVRRSTTTAATAAPYLLFGPPGTGKTQTLIEAVYQVLRAKKDARILLCTSSNAAADDLMLRLVRIFPHNQCPFHHVVYRVLKLQLTEMSPARWRSSGGTEMMDALVASSNYCQRVSPSSDVLRRYSVIVCTLTMSGLLPDCPFTDVFVDECGSATESATLVALQRGCTGARMTANVVLAGDPKQLGPVLKSNDAIAIGYGKSMLERLMSHPAYARDATTNRFPAHLVTKLVLNYRSHPAIIAPSNRLFYDNELQAVGPPQRTHRFVNWVKLPNPLLPIIFHAMCNTYATRGNEGHSWSNRAELDCVAGYIRQLLNGRPAVAQRDIAVITPYRRQLNQMVQQFSVEWPDVVVSTVERFQGRERPVVLVSTVRSRLSIGFLRNQKRLNVMLTRAQGLQIVVGDPLVLMGDREWRDVLAGWKQSGVCVGDSFEV